MSGVGTAAVEAQIGAQAVIGYLERHGEAYVFGVSGSSLVSVFHELADAKATFVPAIHESVAVSAADGYARVTGSATVLLYMAQGVANGMANLYNAYWDETPLLLLAAQPHSTFQTGLGTVIGEGDVTALTRPLTRSAQSVPPGSSLPVWLERAHRIAAGPPSGPVLLGVSEDILLNPVLSPVDRREGRRALSGPSDLSEVAGALAEAQRPLLVLGGQVARDAARDTVATLAERYRIPVVLEQGFNDQFGMSPGHPNCFGRIQTPAGRMLEDDADVVVAVGCRLLLEAHPLSVPRFPAASLIAHVNSDVAKLESRTHSQWSCACSPRMFFEELSAALERLPIGPSLMAGRDNRLARARRVHETVPTQAYAAALGDAMDRGWVVDESISLSDQLHRALRGSNRTRYICTSGAGIGWGAGAACGVALGSGDRVTCVVGDGSMRFGAQALWTARAMDLPITFVVWDNGGFGSTRSFERQYLDESDGARRPGYVGADLREVGPPVEQIIRGYGIDCARISAEDDVRSAILGLWAADGPNAVVVDVGYDAGGWGGTAAAR